MADFDVSIRLGLDYRPGGADRAERDLRELRNAAQRLGTTTGGDELARDLAKAGLAADKAGRDIKEVRAAAERLGAASGGNVLARDIAKIGVAADRSERQVDELRRAQTRLGQGRGADEAASDIRAIGTAADRAERQVRELRQAQQRLGQGNSLANAKREMDRYGRSIGEAGGAAGSMAGGLGRAALALGVFAAPAAILAGLNRMAEGFRNVDQAAAGAAVTVGLLDPETRKQYIETGKRLGVELGAPQGQISAARNVFKSVGLADPQTEAATLGPTVKAAIASGADAGTVAQAGVASLNAFKIRPDQLPKAYDMMLMGTKLGSVEMEDLARNLPALGTQYASAGGAGQGGLKGLAELVALMEVAAKGASSPDEAANNLENYLSNMFSQEAVGNFKDKGVNLPKLVANARSKGQHPAAAILDQVEKMTGGDSFKMGELFGDQQVAAALRTLMQNRSLLDDWTKQIESQAEGTTQRDFDYMNKTPAGQERQRAAKREVSQLTIGEAAEPGAAMASEAWTHGMAALATGATNLSKHFAGIAELYNKEGSLAAFEAAVGVRRSTPEEPAKPRPLDELRAEIDALAGELRAREAERDARAEARMDIPGSEDMPDPQIANLTSQIEQLRAAIQALQGQLASGIQVAPITFNGSWPAGGAAAPTNVGGSGSGSDSGSGGGAATGGGLPPGVINAAHGRSASGGDLARLGVSSPKKPRRPGSVAGGSAGAGAAPYINASWGGGGMADEVRERFGRGTLMDSGPPAPPPQRTASAVPAMDRGASRDSGGGRGWAGRPITINQHFHGTDPRVQADRAKREMRREIKMAEARAMHDTAVPVG